MLSRLTARWAAVVFRYPGIVAVAALAIGIAGGILTSSIQIKSSFSSLLPDNSRAVQDLDAISKRIGGLSTLIVHVRGEDLKAMERFAEALVARLETYPRSEILFIDYKMDKQKAFFERNKFLYASRAELEELRSAISDYVERETVKANPLFVDLSSDDGEKKEDGGRFDFKKKKAEYEERLRKFDKYRDGYLTDAAGETLIIVMKTSSTSSSVAFAEHLTAKVDKEIAAVGPKRFHPSLEVSLTGELKEIPEEYKALRSDIVVVSNLCVGLVLLAVYLYFRSVRMTAILTLGLLGGLCATFGVVYLRIGYLTTATAFLAAIVAGNGINFGIYFLARYMEERKAAASVVDAVHRSLDGTVLSVSVAALAAGASYASLMTTAFKGFNQFGFIGGVGMVLCLLFALTLVPALTVLTERRFPFRDLGRAKYEGGRLFSGGAAFLVERFPRIVLTVGVAAVLAAAVAIAFFLRDPFEYNFRKLRNQYSRSEGAGKRSDEADEILGERSSPHVFLADSLGQVPRIEKALGAYLKTSPDPKKRAIKDIKTVNDYLPGTEAEQKDKLALIAEIRALIVGKVLKRLEGEERDEIAALLPPPDLGVVTMDTLPEELIRPYIELDGTRGTLIYVYMAGSIWNGESIHAFADVVREVKLDNAEVVRSSGKVVIFSDMLRHVSEEGPPATLTAFLAVLVVIIAAYRKVRHVAVVAAAMLSGVILMLGAAAFFGQKINFLNYIAIPIQFGIGVDYAVNVYARFLQEGPGSMGRVLRSTGGAVMITSATTIIGYGAMWFSINGAINSFATLANIGEVTCLLVATLFLPAYLAVFRKGLLPAAPKDAG